MTHATLFDSEDAGASPSEDVLAFTGLADTADAAPAPGFALIDDANGRFVIDAESGFVSVAHEDIVAREHGATHSVRIRVVESSGESYEMEMRLTITGIVPRMAGADAFGDFAVEAPRTVNAPAAPQAQTPPAPFALSHWLDYAAFTAEPGKRRSEAAFAFGAFGALTPLTENGLHTGHAALEIAAPVFAYPEL